MRYVNYMSSTAYKIEYYNENIKLHDFFTDIFIVSDSDTTDREIKKLIALKVENKKAIIKEEIPSLKYVTFKVFRTPYYLGSNNFIEIKYLY